MNTSSKLFITPYPVSEYDIVADSPGVGDTTIYKGYVNPSKGSLSYCCIEKIVILSTDDISRTYAVSSAGANDQMEFNKAWSGRAGFTYKTIYF